MNVAIFASAFYPHVGGVEELVRQLSHEYGSKGLHPIVLTNRWPRSLPSYEKYEGIPVYRLPMRIPEGSFKVRLNYKLTHGAICREMLRILKKHKIELVHVQCVSSNGYYARLAHQALHLPLIVTTQGERTMDAGQLYEKSSFMNYILHSLLTEADYITACSKHTLDDIEQYFGKSFEQRAKPVYNGINLQDFEHGIPYAHPRPYILGVGRLVSQKGFDILIEAFARADVGSYDLLIAGEGPERDSLEQSVQRYGLQDRVYFPGRADRRTVVSLFKGCSFFVLPSRLEPQGIVNLEAMAAGKAVIAANVGGVPEIVLHSTTGILVPPDDIDALAKAIANLATDTQLRNRLGLAGQQRACNFTWPAIADHYIDIYRAATSSANAPKLPN